MFGVPSHLPVNQALQVVEYHMFVGLDLLIGKHNAKVDAGHVHSVLVLYWFSQSFQIKVVL